MERTNNAFRFMSDKLNIQRSLYLLQDINTSGSRYKKVIGAQQIPFLYRKSLITSHLL